MAVWNLPQSRLRNYLATVARPVIGVSGLDQNWAVFAPDPRRQVFEVEARIIYVDGSSETWRPPDADKVVGAYRIYRWRKWAEWVRLDNHRSLWRPAAIYALCHRARNEVAVRRVTLIRRWYDLEPPGRARALPTIWHAFPYFSINLPRRASADLCA